MILTLSSALRILVILTEHSNKIISFRINITKSYVNLDNTSLETLYGVASSESCCSTFSLLWPLYVTNKDFRELSEYCNIHFETKPWKTIYISFKRAVDNQGDNKPLLKITKGRMKIWRVIARLIIINVTPLTGLFCNCSLFGNCPLADL